MEEAVMRWIKEVGFPIFCACLAVWGCVYLFRLREKDRENRDKESKEHAESLAEVSLKATAALDRNSQALEVRTGSIEENTEETRKLSEVLAKTQTVCQGPAVCKFDADALVKKIKAAG